MGRPSPHVNEVSRPFWEGTRDGCLYIQVCNDCGALVHYPRRWCPHCWSVELDHRAVSGEAEVLTFSVVHQGPAEIFTAEGPYVLAIVRLVEGPTMLTNIVGTGAMDVAIGDRVRVDFGQTAGESVLPRFRKV